MRYLSTLILSLAGAIHLIAQQPAAGFSREWLSPLEYKLNDYHVREHSSLQPAAHGLEKSFYLLADSAYAAKAYSSSIEITPLFDLSTGAGAGSSSQAIGFGTVGAAASWQKGDRWSASLGYALTGGLVPSYIGRFADSLRVMPGWGYAVKDMADLYHAHYTFGHVGYAAGSLFHFEIGQGKHFWGDGRRSLILSDVASPYPYFRIDTKVWNIKYTNLWMKLDDISLGGNYAGRRGKYAALHALSWNVTRDFNLTFFEMVVWQDRDSSNRRTMDFNYLNPVVFYRPLEYAQGSADNVLMGLGFKVKASLRLQLYGQLVIDEFLASEVRGRRGWWGNKFGGQIGLKWFDAFTQGLHFQSEFNVVRPFTYTHGSSVQSWGHLNQPLAHPFGANFYEGMLLARFNRGKWNFSEQFTYGAFGRDEPGLNQGGNIFRSYRGPAETFFNSILQGERHTLHYQQFMASRPLEKWKGTEIFFSHVWRIEKSRISSNSEHLLMVGIRSSGLLRNQVDF